jgi:hypothetical protein
MGAALTAPAIVEASSPDERSDIRVCPWTVDGTRMILRQDGIRYAFDGVVVGDRYSGTLYLGEQRVSRFCAVKGETVPQHCEAEAHTSVHNRVGPLA